MEARRRLLLGWLAATALGALPRRAHAWQTGVIRIAAPDTDAEDVQRGLDAGIRETSQTAGLLNRRIERVPSGRPAFAEIAIDDGGLRIQATGGCAFRMSAPPAARAAALAHWLASTGRRRCRTTSSLAADVRRGFADAGVTLVDTGSADAMLIDPNTDEDTGAGILRVALTPVSGKGDAAWVAEWHASLVKFGASDLNERFTRAFHAPMTPRAWCAWVAVKAVGEAALRGGPGADACRALAALRFDGHKGMPLSFQDGELVQPLCLVVREHGREQADFVGEGRG
jgi:hypothetical protein